MNYKPPREPVIRKKISDPQDLQIVPTIIGVDRGKDIRELKEDGPSNLLSPIRFSWWLLEYNQPSCIAVQGT